MFKYSSRYINTTKDDKIGSLNELERKNPYQLTGQNKNSCKIVFHIQMKPFFSVDFNCISVNYN